MALLGADTDELREVAQEFEDGKEVVDDVLMFLKALIAILKAASFFSGGASLAYAEYLETTVVPWLMKISQALGLFAKVLGAQAQAQDQTSDASSVTLSALPSYATPALPAPVTPYRGDPIAGPGGAPTTGTTTGTTTGRPATTSTTTTTTTTTTGPGGVVTTTTTTPGSTTPGSTTGIGSTGIPATSPTAHPAAVPTPTSPPTTAPAALGTSTGIGAGHSPLTGALQPTAASAVHPLTSGAHPALGSIGGVGGGSTGSAGTGGSSGSATPPVTLGSGHGVGGGLTDGVAGGVTGSTPVHTNPPIDGGLGGATPGSAAPAGQLAPGTHAAAGAPVGALGIGAAASGAAALGVGGAALAARGGAGGASGSGDDGIDGLAARNGRGSSGAEVTRLQEQLTSAGYDTHGADGRWGHQTQAAYDAYRTEHPIEVRAGSGYTSPDGYDYSAITGIRHTTPEFLRGVEAMSQRLGAKPEHVLAVMSFETGGTFAADARNPHSTGTGLIQFMGRTARGLGTSTQALAAMSPTEQLPYVEQYLAPHRGRLGDLDSLYSTVLAGHQASGQTPLFTAGTPEYAVNAGLDRAPHDGQVTAAEAAARVRVNLGAGH